MFRDSPSAIFRRFTFGQLAVLGWQMAERVRLAESAESGRSADLDLTRLSGAELTRHLARLGA